MAKNAKLLVPKMDVVFHSLFKAGNEEITKAIISTIIGEKIDVINLDSDKYLVKKYTDEKLGILDLKAKLNNGSLCNIEVQLIDKGNTVQRFLWYWSKIYSSQLQEGEDYSNLKRCICIIILDYELKDTQGLENIREIKEIQDCHTQWKIIEEKNRKIILTNLLEINIIEIPKALKLFSKMPNDKIIQWMKFLDDPNKAEVLKIMEDNKDIKKAYKKLEEISEDKKLRRIAELREKAILDERNAVNYGKRQGIQEGIEQGIEQGVKKGIEKTKLETAKKMKAEKIDINLIVKVTGLTEDEIKKL